MALKDVGVKLVVEGVANFKSQMQGVQTSMSNIKGGVVKYQKQIGAGMAGMGAGILAAGALSVRQFASMGDEIAKMAKRTGFSTEALSELSYVAERSGTQLSGVEKASRTLSGAIVDAGDGLETYVRAFDRIGLSYEQLAGLSPEQQFLKVLSALGQVEDETIQAATASDLFGARMGTQLLPMIYDGTEAFNELRQEAHDLGVIFDKEGAKQAEEMTDAMTKLEKSITGVMLEIAGPLMEVLKPLMEKITGVIKTISGWLDKNKTLKTIIVAVTISIGALLVPIGMLMFLLPSLTAMTAAFGITLSAAIWPVTLMVAAIAALIAIGTVLYTYWDEITAFMKEWGLMILGIIFPAAAVAGAVLKWKKQIMSALEDVWDAIVTAAKFPVNAIIGMWNKLLEFWSNKTLFKIAIPGWVPGIGGKRFELKLPKMPTIPTLAAGGEIMRGGSAIVGERGPELINLPAGAMVRPITNTYNITENYARPETPQSLDLTLQALAMYART